VVDDYVVMLQLLLEQNFKLENVAQNTRHSIYGLLISLVLKLGMLLGEH